MKTITPKSLTALVACLIGLARPTFAEDKAAANPGNTPGSPAAGVEVACPLPCAPVSKVCVPVPGIKKTTKAVHACKEVWYCIPKLPSLWDLFHRDGTCGPECSRPQCKRVLLKRLVTEDCPTVTWEVQNRP